LDIRYSAANVDYSSIIFLQPKTKSDAIYRLFNFFVYKPV